MYPSPWWWCGVRSVVPITEAGHSHGHEGAKRALRVCAKFISTVKISVLTALSLWELIVLTGTN